MTWNIITSEPADARTNMALDTELFMQHEAGILGPTLRLYTWSRHCLTYGYSQQLARDFAIEQLPDAASITAKRPTGGGIVLHNSGDLTYCLVADLSMFAPTIESSCMYIHGIIQKILAGLGIPVQLARTKHTSRPERTSFEKICFATPTRYELVDTTGKKIAGSAQKRGRRTLLQQGTIPLTGDTSFWEAYIKDSSTLTRLSEQSTSIREVSGREFSFAELAEPFIAYFQNLQNT